MADGTFQSMTVDRATGAARARLMRYYIDLGYPPAIASAKAIMETPTAPDPSRTDIQGSDVLRPNERRTNYQGTEAQDFRAAPPYQQEAAMSAYRSGSDTPGALMAGRQAAARREAEPNYGLDTIEQRFRRDRAANTRLGDVGLSQNPQEVVANRDPEASALSERDRLIRFYSNNFPPDQAIAMADRDMGRRMANKAYADAYAKTAPGEGYQPTSQFGRFIKSVADYGASPEQKEALRRQTALNIAKNQIQGISPTFRDQSEADYNAEALRNKTMRDLLYSPEFKNKAPEFVMEDPEAVAEKPPAMAALPIPQGYTKAANGLVDSALSYITGRPAAPAQAAAPAPAAAPTGAPIYDLDPRSVPQDVEGWGRKVDGPSAATSSMDAPVDVVGAAKKVSTAPQRPVPTQQQAAPAPSPETVTLRDLWAAANRPDASASDFFRADRAMQEAIKKGQDVGYYGQAEGKKAGGSVGEKPNKDAAVHKALEIIHHLLTRG
jgi:hypothetical protein